MNKMSIIENLLCFICRNSTIISTEKSVDHVPNRSSNEQDSSKLYSICSVCKIYSCINPGTILFHEKFSKVTSIIADIKYDPKLMSLTQYCDICKKDRLFKMFANSNIDIKYKIICMECDTISITDFKNS